MGQSWSNIQHRQVCCGSMKHPVQLLNLHCMCSYAPYKLLHCTGLMKYILSAFSNEREAKEKKQYIILMHLYTHIYSIPFQLLFKPP